MEVQTIIGSFTEKDFRQLKALYKKAEKDSQQEIKFKNQDLDLQFSKYLIEFLTTRFK
jgi:hypothetical protein